MASDNAISPPTQAQAMFNNQKNEQALNAAVPQDKRVVKLFKTRIPNIGYIFRSGKRAPFLNSRYSTDIPSEIAELEEEISLGHPHIYIDEAELTLDTVEPMEVLRKKFYAEFEAQQKRALDKDNDAGYTEANKIVVATTRSIAEAVGNSDSIASPASPASPASALKVNLNR
jgi:hypothetical protein